MFDVEPKESATVQAEHPSAATSRENPEYMNHENQTGGELAAAPCSASEDDDAVWHQLDAWLEAAKARRAALPERPSRAEVKSLLLKTGEGLQLVGQAFQQLAPSPSCRMDECLPGQRGFVGQAQGRMRSAEQPVPVS